MPVALDDIRRLRTLIEAAYTRDRDSGDAFDADLRAQVSELQEGHPAHAEPNALLPITQLYFRDIPCLSGPEGTDLLQVLWCPLMHDESLPAVHLVWRASSTVAEQLTNPPEPADVDRYGHFVPEPCVLHPEVVSEYPQPLELPEELAQQIHAWSEENLEERGAGSSYYHAELSTAPGWKVGGWGPWSFCDPTPMHCAVCNAEYQPLLTVSSSEWNGDSWVPVEDRDASPYPNGLRYPKNPSMVEIGRGYNMQIYLCPASFDHPHMEYMQ